MFNLRTTKLVKTRKKYIYGFLVLSIRIITSQLKQSPEYLQWLPINRWNGQLPYALGTGAVPFVQLPLMQKSQIQNQTQLK
jgi:hypothetical protein